MSPRSASPASTPSAPAPQPSPGSSAASGASKPCTTSVLRGSPACRMTLHQTHYGELLQHICMGVVLVVGAALTLTVLGQGALVQHLWRDYPVLINRRPGETRNMYGMSGSAPPENIRDVTYDEDSSQIRTGNALRILCTLQCEIMPRAGPTRPPGGRRHNVA